MTKAVRATIAAFCLLSTSSVLAQARSWQISEASGRVTITDTRGTRAAERGMTIVPGATVQTAPGSRAVMVRGPEFVTVSSNSRIRVPEAAQQTGLIQILQDWGTALFRIDKQPNPHFGVKTPYLAAVVKGTTFSVTVSREGASMQVVEGAVEVSTDDGGARELVRPGSLAMVSASDRYRLSVQGDNAHTIDSPARATPSAVSVTPTVTPSLPPASDTLTAGGDAALADAPLGGAAAVTVATIISEKPVDLGKVTNGMITGSITTQLASTMISPVVPTPGAPPNSTAAGDGRARGIRQEPGVETRPARVSAEVEVSRSALERFAEARGKVDDDRSNGRDALGADRSAEARARDEKKAIEAAQKAADQRARDDAKAAEDAAKAKDKADKQNAEGADKADKSDKKDADKNDKPDTKDTDKNDKPDTKDTDKNDKLDTKDTNKNDKPDTKDTDKNDKPDTKDTDKNDKPDTKDTDKNDKPDTKDTDKTDKPDKPDNKDIEKNDKPDKKDPDDKKPGKFVRKIIDDITKKLGGSEGEDAQDARRDLIVTDGAAGLH